jgi:hypothetical protein
VRQGLLEDVQKKYPALQLGLKGNKLLTAQSLDKITRWHVYDASDLHAAALRHRQVLHVPSCKAWVLERVARTPFRSKDLTVTRSYSTGTD